MREIYHVKSNLSPLNLKQFCALNLILLICVLRICLDLIIATNKIFLSS